MFKYNILMTPEDSVSSSGSGGAESLDDKELSKEDVIELLNEESEEEKEVLDLEKSKKEKKETKEDSEEDEFDEESEEESDEENELDELEEELEEPDEDKLELVTPARRKDILAAYPDLFKKFPYLERAYYREQKYTEILPTIKDAEEAVDKAKTLDNFEQELLTGNTETILKAVKDTTPESFNKLVDDYLPTLAKVDKDAYFHVLGGVIKSTITAMVEEGNKSNNDALKSAAHILNQFVFMSSDFEPHKPLSTQKPTEDKSKEDALVQKEREFLKRQYETARDDLSTKVNNTLKSTIDAHIDPNDSMTEYVKKNATREAFENLNKLVVEDSRFRVILEKLWQQSYKDNFSQNSLSKIKSAYLTRAKTLLPSVIKKARNEALKGLARRSESAGSRKGPIPVGKSTTSSNSGKSSSQKAKEIPEGMRSIDYLMQD